MKLILLVGLAVGLSSAGPLLDSIIPHKFNGCEFSLNGDVGRDTQPLFVVPEKFQFWNPNPKGIVQIPLGYSIEMHCTKSFRPPFEGKRKITAVCVGATNFIVDNDWFQIFNFTSFACTSWPAYTARRTGASCTGGTTLAEVGFEVDGGFLQMMEICHDEIFEVTRYVHHKLNPSSANFQRYVDRPKFIEGDFFNGKNVDQIYTRVQQKATFANILGNNSGDYFADDTNVFLSRGHLSAKSDHIYGSQQRGTFYFINAAPQWQVFNAGNWERVEDGVRKWVAKNRMYVDCYTGTWGVSTLPDENGYEKELYLAFDENGNGLIPVPKIYFRVIIEPSTERGIVLIGVNNPHVTMETIQRDYIICDDISEHVSWINWDKEDILSGYSYACEVNQFREVVTHLPTFDVRDILS